LSSAAILSPTCEEKPECLQATSLATLLGNGPSLEVSCGGDGDDDAGPSLAATGEPDQVLDGFGPRAGQLFDSSAPVQWSSREGASQRTARGAAAASL
jgi:hypothetical protein